ncbi:unnamed protein product [Urochloa humidicola]
MAIAQACLQAILRHAVDLVLRQCEASLFCAADRVSRSIITMDNKRFASPQEDYGTPAVKASQYYARKFVAETIHRLLCFVHELKENIDEYHGLNWQSRFNKVKAIRTFLEDLDRLLELDNIYLNRNMMPNITDFGLPMSLRTKGNIPMETNADKIHRLLCFEYVPTRNLGMYLPDDFCGLHWPTHHYNMDLKPGNVLLHENIAPKLTDFGLARCFGGERTQIIEGGSIGTLGYMDPEYIKHGNKISYKSDVYSFGVILLEIVARKAGYSKRSEMSSEEFTEIDILNSANGMTASTSILERTRGESNYVRLAGLSPPNPDNVEDDFRAISLLDSGASMHVVGNARLLHDYSSLPDPYTIKMADGMEVVGKGIIKLGSFIIPNVCLVERLDSILISVNQLDTDHKLCSFGGGICIVRHQVNRLWLSYEDLATQLKQLYLYSALFPKGTCTPRDAVIGMWIREGFIQPSGNSHDDDRLENVVVEYYLGLIKRNLIQPFPGKYCLTDGMSTLASFAEYMAMLNISSCLETWKSTEATSSTVSPIQRAVLSFIFIAAIVAVNIIAQSMVLLLNSGGRALAAAASMHQQLSQNNLTDERSDKPRSNRAPQTNSSDDKARAPMENKLTEDEAENHSDPNSCVAKRDTIEKAKRSGEWYVATGAAHHATGNSDLITNMMELANGGLSVQAADGTSMPVCGRGNVVTDAVVLPDVYYVPGLCTNLVSVGQLAGLDYSVGFGRGNCIVSSPDGTVVGGAHARGDGLYEVDFLRVPLDML